MSVYKDPTTQHIIVEDYSGNLKWSSDRPPVNLLPESNWLTITQSIEFPDFGKFANYAYQRVSPGGTKPPWAISSSGDTCQTVTMIIPSQEWNGPEITLGTVPASANFIDVRVNLNQTKAPNPLLQQTVPPLIAPAQWVHLPGGSCLIEATTVWRRLFTIALNGTSVVLRRKQTTAPAVANAASRFGGIYDNQAPNGNANIVSDYAQWGWVTGDGSGFVGGLRAGHPAASIQIKEFSANSPGDGTPSSGAKHPTRSQRCSVNIGIHDFSSIYSGTITIRPGYIKI